MEESTKKSGGRALNAAIIPFCFLALLWAIHLLQLSQGWEFYWLGIRPGHWEGLMGILTAPLIHGQGDPTQISFESFKHLVNNSAPLLVLGWTMFYFYRPLAIKVIVFIQLFSGLWIWLSARESYHIGASGLVYGMLAFIFLSGILRREQRLVAISLLVTFLYGGMFWGIFPIKVDVSWESHLMGGMAGILLALYYRKEGPQRRYYQWELDELQERKEDQHHTGGGYRKIVYHYQKNGGHEQKGEKE